MLSLYFIVVGSAIDSRLCPGQPQFPQEGVSLPPGCVAGCHQHEAACHCVPLVQQVHVQTPENDAYPHHGPPVTPISLPRVLLPFTEIDLFKTKEFPVNGQA